MLVVPIARREERTTHVQSTRPIRQPRCRGRFAGEQPPASGAEAVPRPNILWLTCEDTGPQLGCYGDKYADTPSLDALAAKGTLYTHCWSNAPVCAPARTTLISGLYPTSTGAEHMRSMTQLPAGF